MANKLDQFVLKALREQATGSGKRLPLRIVTNGRGKPRTLAVDTGLALTNAGEGEYSLRDGATLLELRCEPSGKVTRAGFAHITFEDRGEADAGA